MPCCKHPTHQDGCPECERIKSRDEKLVTDEMPSAQLEIPDFLRRPPKPSKSAE